MFLGGFKTFRMFGGVIIYLFIYFCFYMDIDVIPLWSCVSKPKKQMKPKIIEQ